MFSRLMAYQLDSEEDFSDSSEDDEDEIEEEKIIPAAALVPFEVRLPVPDSLHTPDPQPSNEEIIEDIVVSIIDPIPEDLIGNYYIVRFNLNFNELQTCILYYFFNVLLSLVA